MKNLREDLILAACILVAVSGPAASLYAIGIADGPHTGANTSLTSAGTQENNRDKDKDKDQKEENNSRDDRQCGDSDRDDKGNDKGRGESGHLAAIAPGANTPNLKTLLSAVSIVNNSKQPVERVEVTSIELKDGKRTAPASLPADLGSIAENGAAVLYADFSGGPFRPESVHTLRIQGTYSIGDERKTKCEFRLSVELRIPPAAPGSNKATSVTVGSKEVSGAHYPAQPPNFNSEVNRPNWTIPRGPFVPGKPTPTSTGTEKAPIGDPPAIDFVSNSSLGVGGGSIAEPSGSANGGGVVFTSANWLAAFSTNSGNSFTALNPTTIFPPDAVGFCCDQIVQYAPTIDRFIWLLQGSGVRLAVASPTTVQSSSGTAWTYWDLTPALFGLTGGFDYPDLSVGNNFLYMSWNAAGGHLVVRTSLAGLQAGGTISLGFTHPADSSMAGFAHLAQDTRDEIFWAGHNSTSNMRIFSWAENTNTYFWRDVNVASWTNSGYTSTTPDNQNWLSEVKAVGTWIAGATRSGNNVWFAWTAGPDDRFKQVHVDMVTLDRSNNFNVAQQVQIWNNDYAFAYPALATNACTAEVGLSLEYGGNGHFENHVVGFWGDFLVYVTTASDTGTSRFGDYVTIRQEPPTKADPGNLFDAYGYGITAKKTDIHYVLFGRPASVCRSEGNPHPTPTPKPEIDRCVCEDGFQAGPTVKQGSVACEHICRGHERH